MKPILIALAFFTAGAQLFAQGGSVTGVVRDAAASPVPGAVVTATRVGTGRSLTAVSSASGAYLLANLAAGSYLVEASTRDLFSEAVEIKVESGRTEQDFAMQLRPVSATLTVVEQASPETERVPGGTAFVPEADIRQSRAHNLEDVLQYVPGVVVQSRFGADESQLSIRGSGLRNNFHSRGINLLVNGIPYQDADGFSDFESLELFATERVQVWKGANALQYGGSSLGGAINLVTYDAASAPLVSARVEGGSFDLLKAQLAIGGRHDKLGYFLSLSSTDLDGFREHSEQSRFRVLGNADLIVGDRTTLRGDLIYADVKEDLPGSLTRQQFESNPEAADPTNVANDYGRDFNYTRLAFQMLHSLAANQQIGVYVYGQHRDMVHPIFQFLDQEAINYGAETNYRATPQILGRNNRFVVGATYLTGDADEKRYANVGGEAGILLSKFRASATSYALYFEDQLDFTPTLTATLGGRYDSAGREYLDQFPSDGDRSDSRRYNAFSPRIGLSFAPSSALQLFGNVSHSHEPPLILELTSYGAPGFIDLEAQSAWQYEIGSRGHFGSNLLSWDVALFDIELEHEIINLNVRPFPGAPFTIPSYRNVDRSRHRGAELGLNGTLPQTASLWRWRLAYTRSDFTFVNDREFGNNALPGAPVDVLRAELRYERPNGFWIAPEFESSLSRYAVNSANTSWNEPYNVVNLGGGYRLRRMEFVGGINNIGDETYSGSVVVDSAVGRFYEPSPSRSYWAGIIWRMDQP